MAQLKMPYFCRGTEEKLREALETGIFKNLDRIVWCFITEGERAGQLILVDHEKNVYPMVGDNKKQVKMVETLPSLVDGDTETLYLLGSIIYTFDGTQYNPSFHDYTEEITDLTGRMEAAELAVTEQGIATDELSDKLDNLTDGVSELTETVEGNASEIEEINTNIEAINSQLTNVGVSIADMYTKEEMDEKVQTLSENVYTKSDIDVKFEDTYSKNEVDNMISEIETTEVVIETHVTQAKEEAVEESKNYVDEVMKLYIV